jgi:hypothetical protein
MATETLRPNAAGDETALSPYPNSGEANWEDVDEETPDEGDTRVYKTGTSYTRDLYNLPSHSVGSGTINFIKIYFRCQRPGSGTSCRAEPSLKSDGVVTDGTEVTLTSSYTTYSEQWSTNPADSQPWEWTDIDALQIGVRLKGDGTNPARCTQVYVEVDYTATTSKESSDTGAGVDAKASDNPIATLTDTETGSGVDSPTSPLAQLAKSDVGSGVDAVASLQTPEAKSSSDTGAGAEGTSVSSAILAGSESGSGIEAIIARLLTDDESGNGSETSSVETEGALENLFASELGEGADRLVAKIEIPVKGGGMKLWT